MESKQRKVIGALLSAVVVIAMMLAYIVFLLWVRSQDVFPGILFIVLTGIYVMSIVAVIAVLIQRIKEIQSGEEEDAGKY